MNAPFISPSSLSVPYLPALGGERRLFDSFAAYGNAPALLFPGRPAITYAQLDRRVAAFAEQVAGKKRLLALEAASSADAIIAYLGALRAGHAVALLPPEDRTAWEAFAERFAPEFGCRQRNGSWRLEQAARRHQTEKAIHPDLALILLTSGSTGQGKAVRLSTQAVAANAASIADYLDLTPDDRAALILPLHYSYGLSVLNAHLSVGASIHAPGGSILDPGFIVNIREARCTNISGVPCSYDLFERIGFRDETLPDLRLMTVAGGRLPARRVRDYHAHLARRGADLFLMYGQTEATARIAYVPPERLPEAADSIGIAVPGGELALVDKDGRIIDEPEAEGELVYRGPNVMMGYAETRADLAKGGEVGELRTGDLAARGADGLYRIVGRLKRMSKIAGIRIGHDALEAALAEAGIEAAVTGDDRSLAVAYSTAHAPAKVAATLAMAAKIGLNRVRAVRVGELPRLANGKLDHERVRSLVSEERDSRPADVATAFRQAFYPYPVRSDDSFVALGGDSLRYIELSMALEQRLGHLPERWEEMTIGELDELGAAGASGLRAISTDLVIRTLAILLVVVNHSIATPIPGGSALMVVLIGYSLARFQRNVLAEGDFARFFRPLGLVLIPYYAIFMGYSLAWGTVPWPSLLLVSNLGFGDPDAHTMLPFLYWFVEAYVQMMLLFAALFLLPPVRRFAAADAFGFGVALIATAVGARFLLPEIMSLGSRKIFTLPWFFYLAAFGWCAALADTTAKRLTILGAAAVVMPLMAYYGGNWHGSWTKYSIQLAAIGLLLYVPRMTLPAVVARLVLPIAAGSYHIYLFHRFVPNLLLEPFALELPRAVFETTAIGGGVALGLVVHALQKRIVAYAANFRFGQGREASAVA